LDPSRIRPYNGDKANGYSYNNHVNTPNRPVMATANYKANPNGTVNGNGIMAYMKQNGMNGDHLVNGDTNMPTKHSSSSSSYNFNKQNGILINTNS
jgi:hypothetical protein